MFMYAASFSMQTPLHYAVLLIAISFSLGNQEELQLGTTLVAIKFIGGIALAADTRTSMSTFVANRFAEKIERISDHVSMARSGSAADTQELARRVKDGVVHPMICKYGKHLTTSEVAHWLRQEILKRKEEMSVGLLLAGCDSGGSGEIYSVTQTGAILQEKGEYAAGGSGSVYVMGYLDERLRDSNSLSEQEAITLCRKAIETAILRDGSSGGMIRLHVITPKGTRVETFPTALSSRRKVPAVPGFADPVGLPVPIVSKRNTFVP